LSELLSEHQHTFLTEKRLYGMFVLETTIPIMRQRIRQLWVDNRLPLEEAVEQVGYAPSFLA